MARAASHEAAASPTPAATSLLALPVPLPIAAPPLIADAGILPSSLFSFLDRLDEFFERTVFSFGIPSLRARIALAQAAERMAELQALERRGELTPWLLQRGVAAHRRLIAVADAVVARRLARGGVRLNELEALLRTRFSAAQVLEDLREEQEVEANVVESLPAGEENGEPTAEEAGTPDVRDALEEAVADLDEVEEDLVPSGPDAALPRPVLRLLAEQKIAKAERDLARAVAKTEERIAHGKILVARDELQQAATMFLQAARALFDEGNFSEALAVSRDARRLAARLNGGTIALEPNALRSPRGLARIDRVLRDLAEEGLLSTEAERTARERAEQAVAALRAAAGRATD